MLLAIDIGNTNLVIGCIENDKILFKARIATDAIRTSDQYGVEIKNMMEAFGVQVKDIDDCIISSVVPRCSIRSKPVSSRSSGSSPWWSARG